MENTIISQVYWDKEMNSLYNRFEYTPMMKEWKDIKEETSKQYGKNTILFFQVGTFYEAYFHDAVIISRVLWFTLTKKNKSKEDSAVMSWMPLVANLDKLQKLLELNFNIIFVSEVPDDTKKTGIGRVITKIITPSTNLDFLNKDNNYLLSIFLWTDNIWLSFLDISTGEFKFAEFSYKEYHKIDLIYKYNIKEVIINKEPDKRLKDILEEIGIVYFNIYKPKEKNYIWIIEHHFGSFIEELDLYNHEEAIYSTFTALSYAKRITKSELSYIIDIDDITDLNNVRIDKNTINNLELVTTYNGGRKKSLYGILNNTMTPFGSRLLRKNILAPLTNQSIIQDRLNLVEYLYSNNDLLDDIRILLSHFYDIEKLASKLWNNSINPIDIINLNTSLLNIKKIQSLNITNHKLLWYINKLFNYKDFSNKIEDAFLENPCTNIREWNIFKEWYNKKLDEERDIFYNIENILKKEEQNLLESSGLSFVKIINNTQWFFIEVKNGEVKNVPEDWIYLKSLNTKTRYTTNKINELNKKYKLAEIIIKELEYKLFQELRIELSQYIPYIIKDANILSEIDIVATFAYNAKSSNYTKPIISDIINIKNWRHPIIENINMWNFSANDYEISNTNIKLITWPNMWWKSTYLKQNALIYIMFQIGSFIPADNWSELSIIDGIFSRIWANDNIERWLSTFAMEMIEMWYICNYYTENSLVLLDEVWRWTDTKNGLALSQAFLEFFIENKKWNILFSTHYSDLIEIADKYNNAENLKVLVEFDDNKNIIFLHKVVKGSEYDSYWIEIAQLHNIPDSIINRAKILKKDK